MKRDCTFPIRQCKHSLQQNATSDKQHHNKVHLVAKNEQGDTGGSLMTAGTTHMLQRSSHQQESLQLIPGKVEVLRQHVGHMPLVLMPLIVRSLVGMALPHQRPEVKNKQHSDFLHPSVQPVHDK